MAAHQASQQASISLFVKSYDQSVGILQGRGAKSAGAADGQAKDFLPIGARVELQQFLTFGDQDLLAALESLF